MKDERKQSKKHHESTIGKIIYGFLLFLPLFAIGSACLISTFNMQAKQESEIHYKYETNDVNSYIDLVPGNAYHIDLNNQSLFATNNKWIHCFYLKFDYFYIENSTNYNIDELNFDYHLLNNNNYLELTLDQSYITIYFFNPDENSYINSYIELDTDDDTYHISFDFVLKAINPIEEFVPYISRCENIPIDYVETHNVSAQDVFYNAVNKIQQSPLFNWTTNTGIYTVLNNTCNNLGITTTFIPLLLTYWLLISVIYILYDIVLMMLVIFHRKVHCLQDSI